MGLLNRYHHNRLFVTIDIRPLNVPRRQLQIILVCRRVTGIANGSQRALFLRDLTLQSRVPLTGTHPPHRLFTPRQRTKQSRYIVSRHLP